MHTDKYFDRIKAGFLQKFDRAASDYFVAPGRVEIIGNHTDHQHGRTLSMTVDRYIYAAVAVNDSNVVYIYNEGYTEAIIVDLSDLAICSVEYGTSMALVRGVAFYFKKQGYNIGSFDAYTISTILRGMGLSSSAAFEVLIAQVFNHYFNDGKIDDLEIAKASQFAEQVYFNKPCGLLDQMTVSYGGLVYCDFNNQENPVLAHLDKISDDLHFFVIDTGKSHAKLTDHYALITSDLAKVSKAFGKEYLIDVDEMAFTHKIDQLKLRLGERALKRAQHIFDENRRVIGAFATLNLEHNENFLKLIRSSGMSSRNLLQNLTYPGDPDKALIKCFDRLYKKTDFGVRVNGGGFAGTLIVMTLEADDKAKIAKVLEKENVKILPVKMASLKAGFYKHID